MKRELVLHNNISEIEKLAQFIEEFGDGAALAPDMVFQLNLVLEEAVSNIILYAYPEGVAGDITIVAASDGRELSFVVEDRGKEFDPTQVEDADVTLGAEEREIGGLGIFLVRQIMDSFEYKRTEDKNILTLKKHL